MISIINKIQPYYWNSIWYVTYWFNTNEKKIA